MVYNREVAGCATCAVSLYFMSITSRTDDVNSFPQSNLYVAHSQMSNDKVQPHKVDLNVRRYECCVYLSN